MGQYAAACHFYLVGRLEIWLEWWISPRDLRTALGALCTNSWLSGTTKTPDKHSINSV